MPPAAPAPHPRPRRSTNRRPTHLAYAVTAPGLEALTARELVALGVAGPRVGKGGVSFRATTRQLYVTNLCLRTATRVVVRAARFTATSFAALEAGTRAADWSPWLVPGRPVRVRAASQGSRLYHTGAIAQRVAGILGGAAEGADDDEECPLVLVRVNHDEVTISIDASGTPLPRRGYRLAGAKAPLRESLAAALLLELGWTGTTPLVDPFCGSGTIPIEAALLARRLPPGGRRPFACHYWPSFEPGTWASVTGEARGEALDTAPAPIAGHDRDAGAIAGAAANAERAGVAGDLTLATAPISEARPPTGSAPGWLVTNPPYGFRVGGGDLRDLYARVGQVARDAFAGWSIGLLVADPRLAAHTGLRLEERLRCRNGGIDVRFLVAVAE